MESLKRLLGKEEENKEDPLLEAFDELKEKYEERGFHPEHHNETRKARVKKQEIGSGREIKLDVIPRGKEEIGQQKEEIKEILEEVADDYGVRPGFGIAYLTELPCYRTTLSEEECFR